MPPTIHIERLPQSRVSCRLTFSPEEVETVSDEIVRERGQSMTVPGFRPGRAPLHLVRERLNDAELHEASIERLVPRAILAVAKEHALQPVIRPQLRFDETDRHTVHVVFVQSPEVQLKPVTFTPDQTPVTVDEKDIQRVIDYVLRQHQKTAVVERAAQRSDRLTIDFRGQDETGAEVPGARSTGRQVILGSNELIPGFEDALVGLRSGEEKTFTIAFPDTYQVESLRSKPVTFHVHVSLVEEVTMPAFDDAFAKDVLQATSAAAFRDDIASSLRAQEAQAARQRSEQRLFEAITAATVVDLAPELIEEEQRDVLDDFHRRLGEQGIQFDQWLRSTGKNTAQVQEDFRAQATRRLTLRFGLEKLIADKHITVSSEEIAQSLQQRVAGLSPDRQAAAQSRTEMTMQIEWQKKVEKLIDLYLPSTSESPVAQPAAA